MSDTTVEETESPEAPGRPMPGTKTASCPECDWSQEPMAFARQWGMLYSHMKNDHDWSPAQVDAHKAARGVLKPDAVTSPRADAPNARVNRSRKRASNGEEPPEPPPVGPRDFQKKLAEAMKVADVIQKQVNPVLLASAPVFLGIPPQLMADPRVGQRLQTTIAFSYPESVLFGAAAVFGESEFLAKLLEKLLPPALAMCAGAVAVAHTVNVLRLRAEIAAAVAVRQAPQPPPAYANGAGPPPPVVDVS